MAFASACESLRRTIFFLSAVTGEKCQKVRLLLFWQEEKRGIIFTQLETRLPDLGAGSGSNFFFAFWLSWLPGIQNVTDITGEARGQGCMYLCQEDAEVIPDDDDDDDDDDDEQVLCQQHVGLNEQAEEDPMLNEQPDEDPEELPGELAAKEEVKEEMEETEQDLNLEWEDDEIYGDGKTLGRAERKAKEDCFS